MRKIFDFDKYPYCEHRRSDRQKKYEWKDKDYLLKLNKSKYSIARRRY